MHMVETILPFREYIEHCTFSYPFHARWAVYIVSFLFMNIGRFLVIFIVIIEKKYKRRNMCLFANTDQLHLSKMTITFSVLFGSAKLFGLVQIPNATDKVQSEVIFDIIFGFNYSSIWSIRGISLFTFYTALEKCREHSRTVSRVSDFTWHYKGSETWQIIKTNATCQEVTKSIGEYFQMIVSGGERKRK